MKFIKASDQLPPDKKDYNGKLKGRPAIIHDWKLAKGYVTANGHLERVGDVEWLDEETTDDQIIEELREQLKAATEHDNTCN